MRYFLLVLWLLFGIAQASTPFPGLEGIELPQYPQLPTIAPLPKPKDVSVAPDHTQREVPDYSQVSSIYSWPDFRLGKKLPMLEVIHVPALRKWQEGKKKGKCKEQSEECPKHEWSVPISLVKDSMEVAKGLRAAWQRFEDRAYWRVMTQLNITTNYPVHCGINWQKGLNTKLPDLAVHVPSGVLPKQLSGKIPVSEPNNELYLESYLPFPAVHNADFCDGLNFIETPPNFMLIPGGCINFFGAETCIGGGYNSTGPGMGPVWFNMDEAVERVRRALVHINTKYYAEYQADVLKELSPGKHPFFFPLPWHSHIPGDGAIIAPVMNLEAIPWQFMQLPKKARERLGGLTGSLAEQYYFQSVYRSPALDLLLLPTRKDVLMTPPGAWELEEFKRTLMPTSLPYYERMGYMTFFEAWQEFKTTVLPEPTAAKPLRPILFHTYAVDHHIDFSGDHLQVRPTSIPIAPYLIPFANFQAKFGWTSVPEGYQIPRVSGPPLFDYASLVR